jgi:uncharacterized membrane protein/thiol-disulfide isomerase/thioredoxin
VKQYHIIIPILLLISLLIAPITTAGAQASSVVRAVLFYSPTCGHCQYVINETILPLMEKYGDQLQIIGLDVTQSYEQTLYLSALQKFGLEQGGVPFLVIDNMYLVGSLDIPEKFPGLVETYHKRGGVDWPDIPGLREAISQSSEADVSTATVTATLADDPTATAPIQAATFQATPMPATVISSSQETPTLIAPIATPGLITPDAPDSDWTDIFARDPAGNALAVLVLMGMLASVAWTVTLFQRTNGISIRGDWAWIIPILCVVGFGVAGYLAYVETAQVTAVCGPVGDCNTVQQSDYARLFGILPIGMLGMIGYVTIIIAWLIARNIHDRLADLAVLSLFAMTVFGTLFSIYLTYLEPFVIGATCAWCLTSSVLMMVLMLLSVGPAKAAFSKNPFTTSLRRRHPQTGVHDD